MSRSSSHSRPVRRTTGILSALSSSFLPSARRLERCVVCALRRRRCGTVDFDFCTTIRRSTMKRPNRHGARPVIGPFKVVGVNTKVGGIEYLWFACICTENDENVRSQALIEEHARDSFENLIFSVCHFRELTRSYPQNITVVSYDFKEERFAQLHRSVLGFPKGKFFFPGTPTTPTTREAAVKGEASVRSQF
ncbi:hypothetical protein ABZP36_002343 [Zizania latifolia]